MNMETIRRFAEKYKCSVTTAAYYYELRAEGLAPEAALIWCGLSA